MVTVSEAQKRDVAQRCAHFNLKRTVRRVTQHFDVALASSGLHITQFTLLVTSSLRGPSPITELADELTLDRTSLTRALEPLVRNGLMEVVPGDVDRRQRLVRITAKGESTLAHAYPAWQTAQEEVTAELDQAEYSALLDALEHLQPQPA